MRNRLIISLILVLALLLTGCGGSESLPSESESSQFSSITESERSENEEKVSSL